MINNDDDACDDGGGDLQIHSMIAGIQPSINTQRGFSFSYLMILIVNKNSLYFNSL